MSLDEPRVLIGAPEVAKAGGRLDVRRGAAGGQVHLTVDAASTVKLTPDEPTADAVAAWFAPSYLPLTVPPTIVGGSRDPRGVAAVVKGNQILQWDGGETRLDKVAEGQEGATVATVNTPIAELLDPFDDGDLLAVTADGGFQRLSVLVQNGQVPEGHLPRGHRLDSATAVFSENGGKLYVVLVSSPPGGQKASQRVATVVRVREEPENGGVTSTLVKSAADLGKNAHVLAVLQSGARKSLRGNQPRIVYRDAEGALALANLFREGQTAANDHHESVCLLSKNELSASAPVKAAAAADGHIALLAVSSVGNEDNSTLYLIHLGFGLVLETRKVEGRVTELEAIGQRFFFTLFDGNGGNRGRVMTISADAAPTTLEGMIGLREAVDNQKTRKQRRSSGGHRATNIDTPSGVAFYRRVTAALRSADIDEVDNILVQSHDLPELLLLGVIELLLMAPDQHFSSTVARERLIWRALCAPLTQSLMLPYLAKASLDVTLALLDFLERGLRLEAFRTWSEDESVNENGEENSKLNGRLESLIMWTSMVTSARYTDLVVTKDARAAELLESLANTTSALDEAVSSLSKLAPLVRLIDEGRMSGRGRSGGANTDYFIEVVEF